MLSPAITPQFTYLPGPGPWVTVYPHQQTVTVAATVTVKQLAALGCG